MTAENDDGACGSGVTFTFNGTSGKLTVSGTGDMQDFAKPEDAPWYSYRAAIRKIEIGADVASIGDYAFYNCAALERVEITSTTAVSIGKYAFWMCSALEEIEFPASVTEIGEGAFAYCTTLSSISVSGLATLGASAFAGCTALEVVSFDGAISAIPEKAFMNCTALKTVAYPDSVAAANVASDAFLNTNKDLDQSVVKSEATLTIRYVNEAQADLAPAYTAVLAKGAEYSVPTPSVTGYTIPAGQEIISGVMPGADRTVLVVYQADAAEEVTTDSDETAAVPGGSDEEKEPDKKTPIGFLVLLIIVLVAIAVGAILLLRSNQNVTKDSQTVRKSDAEKNAKKKRKK